MTRAVYFDCFSGVAGDMIIGSLLDAGLDFDTLKKGLDGLHLPGYHITADRVERSSIMGTKFDVVIEDEPAHEHTHDHEHEHSHDHPHEHSHDHDHHHHDHEHDHEHGHEHSHDHEHEHHHHEHTHEASHDHGAHQHRGLTDILKIIDAADISDNVKKQATEIFTKLGKVEANIHGVTPDEVHFHELGAIDTIIDIVGTLLGLEALGITKVYSSPLATGNGTVKTAHGVLPVPAPATLQILTDAAAPLADSPASDKPSGELITPTGAVLITSLVSEYRRPNMKPEKIGYGAGTKQFPGWPNVVRAWVGEDEEMTRQHEMSLLETNIDDMSPEVFGFTMERLLEAGAADVWFTPIHMKKNRPAIMLSVLCSAEKEAEITEIIMRETTTLGIRSRSVSRHVAQREIKTVETSLGPVPVKIKQFNDFVAVSPEFEDCRRIAKETGLALQHVLRTVENEARLKLGK